MAVGIAQVAMLDTNLHVQVVPVGLALDADARLWQDGGSDAAQSSGQLHIELFLRAALGRDGNRGPCLGSTIDAKDRDDHGEGAGSSSPGAKGERLSPHHESRRDKAKGGTISASGYTSITCFAARAPLSRARRSGARDCHIRSVDHSSVREHASCRKRFPCWSAMSEPDLPAI